MMRAQIAFEIGVGGSGDWFTLDDAVKGVLDGTTYLLAGTTFVDVTNYLREVSVTRGRSSILDRTVAGIASLVLDNRNRYFDPSYTDSPYYGTVLPRKEVRLDVDGAYLYIGNVEDWNFEWDISGDAIAQALCVDGLGVVGAQVLPALTETSELSGARITSILDEINWPTAKRVISGGNATLDANVRDEPVNALDYIFRVVASEPGFFFVNKEGSIVYQDRGDLQTAGTATVTFGDQPGSIPMTGVDLIQGTDELFNTAYVTWTSGATVAGTATAFDTASQASYGVIDRTINTFLDTEAEAQSLADWLVGQNADGRLRFDAITTRFNGLTAAQQAAVLNLELGDVVEVSWTPNSIGSAISELAVIDGIRHLANPNTHDITFTLSQTQAGLLLNDTALGLLNTDHLGF